jgi:hypothetical protein
MNRSSPDICPNCNKPMNISSASVARRCGNCGALIVPTPGQAQLQLPLPVASAPVSGPLLTGYVGLDTVMGVAGEFIGMIFIIYAFYLFFSLPKTAPITSPFITFLTIFGTLATAFLLFKHADTMRGRYPNYERGWQMGRNTWGRAVEQVITLVVGAGVLVIFFPLLMLLVNTIRNAGFFGWVLTIGIAYMLGTAARRMTRPRKGNNIP